MRAGLPLHAPTACALWPGTRRLYQTKGQDEEDLTLNKLEKVQLKFDESGKEQWVPVKKVDPTEQQEYMRALYDRCLESKKKTEEQLAEKYLQPLGKPRKMK